MTRPRLQRRGRVLMRGLMRRLRQRHHQSSQPPLRGGLWAVLLSRSLWCLPRWCFELGSALISI